MKLPIKVILYILFVITIVSLLTDLFVKSKFWSVTFDFISIVLILTIVIITRIMYKSSK
ncbi:hypothetical protein JOD45_000647 [Scopulibacillus daqui]|uniref:Uncharacterized protein n=1 Tax=Scopulibacillus daqui TaxID=1469162 RepID=A0ABS2PWM5_9BACL|nr:hypothetical protein [Scopulibacillus daqui]